MDFFQYMPLNQAKDIITDNLSECIVDSEVMHLSTVLGRIAAKDVVATENLPPFSRSTVDGFAVRSVDTFGANEASPSLFDIVGEIAMGEHTRLELFPGQTVIIPTGGMMPMGADAVVMLENTEQPDSEMVLILKLVAPGENVIAKGEDIQVGEIIIKQGQKIEPQHIGILAACGCVHVAVRKRVVVAVLSTGDELVDICESVEYGQIRDINSYTIGAMLEDIGCEVKYMGIVKDHYNEFLQALTQGITTCNLVVISGGSSVGARDYTVKAIDAIGTPGVLIHGIAIKPGKPTIFGMSGIVPIFGLPGHPVAAMNVCEQLVKLAVHTLTGQIYNNSLLSIPARLDRNLPSAPGRDDFIPVHLSKQEGQYTVTPIFGKSGLISVMAKADGMLHVEEGKSGLYAGEQVEVLLI